MSLKKIKDALLKVGVPVFHFEAHKVKGPYIVWAEDGASRSVWANGRLQEQTLTGTIDYYTTMENDPHFIAVQTALNDAGIAFWLNSVQYEDQTKYIHYEWVWEI